MTEPIVGQLTYDPRRGEDRTAEWSGWESATDTQRPVPNTRAPAARLGFGDVRVSPTDFDAADPATHAELVVPMSGTIDMAYRWQPQSGSGAHDRIGPNVAYGETAPDWNRADNTGRAIRRRQPTVAWDSGSEIG